MHFTKGDTVYAQSFGTGQKWIPAIVQDVTGPFSFLVKLQDGRLIRRHQDHLRRRVADSETETPVESDEIPEILIDSFTTAPTSPVVSSSGDNGPAATLNAQESPANADASGAEVQSPESTTETVPPGGVNARNTTSTGTPETPKTYPKRRRNKPDWYSNH